MWRGDRIELVARHASNSGVLLFDWHLKTHTELGEYLGYRRGWVYRKDVCGSGDCKRGKELTCTGA